MQDRCQTRIRSRIVHCLGKLVRQLLDAGVDENRLQLLLDENRQHLPFRVPVPQRVLFHKGFCPLRVMTWKRLDGLLSTGLVQTQTNLGSRVAGNTVTFVEEPEVKVFSTRVSSRKWVRLLRKYPHLEIFSGIPGFSLRGGLSICGGMLSERVMFWRPVGKESRGHTLE